MAQTNFVLMVLYDVPTTTQSDKKLYRRLTKYLQKTGFYGLQHSVYIKPLSEKIQAEKDIIEISSIIPNDSHVRSIVLTHQQFLTMRPISGNDGWGEYLIRNPNNVIIM